MLTIKYLITAVVITTTACSVNGATSFRENKSDSLKIHKEKADSMFNLYRKIAKLDFEMHRKRVNEEYAEALKGTWDLIETKISKQTRSSLPKPLIYQDSSDAEDNSYSVKEIIPEDTLSTETTKIELQTPKEKVNNTLNAFNNIGKFYGTPIFLSQPYEISYSLTYNTPSGVSAMWEKMSDDVDLYLLIDECLQLKKRLNLNDWGYYKLTQFISDKVSGEKDSDSSRLINMFILANSGYRVRIGKAKDRLQLLIPFNNNIAEWSATEIDNINHYIITDKAAGDYILIFPKGFHGEKISTLNARSLPKLLEAKSKSPILSTEIVPEITIEVNKNLIDYFNDIPVANDLEVYVNPGISPRLKKQLYPLLKSAISDKDEKTALETILKFVQKNFNYQSDKEQFGYERPFFADESFYYPYNDCEDRAILFNILVKDLLQLKTVLLSYEKHVASAVKLSDSENVIGDTINLPDGNYIICDPTFIGADLGQSMPEFKDIAPEIINIR